MAKHAVDDAAVPTAKRVALAPDAAVSTLLWKLGHLEEQVTRVEKYYASINGGVQRTAYLDALAQRLTSLSTALTTAPKMIPTQAIAYGCGRVTTMPFDALSDDVMRVLFSWAVNSAPRAGVRWLRLVCRRWRTIIDQVNRHVCIGSNSEGDFSIPMASEFTVPRGSVVFQPIIDTMKSSKMHLNRLCVDIGMIDTKSFWRAVPPPPQAWELILSGANYHCSDMTQYFVFINAWVGQPFHSLQCAFTCHQATRCDALAPAFDRLVVGATADDHVLSAILLTRSKLIIDGALGPLFIHNAAGIPVEPRELDDLVIRALPKNILCIYTGCQSACKRGIRVKRLHYVWIGPPRVVTRFWRELVNLWRLADFFTDRLHLYVHLPADGAHTIVKGITESGVNRLHMHISTDAAYWSSQLPPMYAAVPKEQAVSSSGK